MQNLRKKGFTLIELLVVLAIVGILAFMSIGLLGHCFGGGNGGPLRITGGSPYEDKLRSASVITIKEKIISWGKHYDIYVDDEKVAEVAGKGPHLFGDVFTLKTVDNKKLAYEEECKRFLRLNRTAICRNGNGDITGYIGEETLKDFLSLSYVFHFYDATQTEIGKSKKLGKSALSKHKLYDNGGTADYDIDKKFRVAGIVSDADKYVLKVLDNESEIPLEYAIFITCIEDAIADAH